jgi:hypothetical protein
MNQSEGYKSFISELVETAPEGWERILLKFEYYPWKGRNIEKYQCFCFISNLKSQFHPSLEAVDELILIHKLLADANPEPWTHCEFELLSTGAYNFDFKYGMPPLTKIMLKTSDEI